MQEVSGVRIFTGSAAMKWFMKNMDGVTNLQVAQVTISNKLHKALPRLLVWIPRADV